MIRKLFKLIFSEVVFIALLLLIQVLVLVIGIWKLSTYFVYIYGFLTLLSLVVAVRVINKKDNPSYKLAWVIPILLVPVFGGLFYLIISTQKLRKKVKNRLTFLSNQMRPYLLQNATVLEDLKLHNGDIIDIKFMLCYEVQKKIHRAFKHL